MTSPDTPRTTRGGPYVIIPRHGRSAYRNFSEPGRAITYLGFRVVCLPLEVKPAPVVSRGGAWCNCFHWRMRSSSRDRQWPHRADDLDGFRVVCLPREVAPPRMVLRGGSWLSFPGDCRSAPRGLGRPDFADGLIGFRVVCLPREVAP